MTQTATLADGLVGIIHYTLRDDAGTVLDSSVGDEPMPYLHGADNIVAGLEAALAGRAVGDKLTVAVAPADGYGERSGAQDQAVPREAFPDDLEIEPGMEFLMDGEQGVVPIWVKSVTDDTVFITLDHPLAGQTLHFDVEVVGIRQPTRDELDHGHPHGVSGDEGHHH